MGVGKKVKHPTAAGQGTILSPTEASSFAGIVHALSKHHFHAERRYCALEDANFGLCAYEEKKAFFPGSRML